MLLGTDLLCGVGRYVLIGNNRCTVLPSVEECAQANRIHVTHLLAEYAHRFASNISEIGTANTSTMKIELTTASPVCQMAHRIPFAKRELVNDIVRDLLNSGIITTSNSPYSSPIVLFKKANGEDRMCIDYRALNAITVKQPFPMPVVEELLAKLAGNTYFTSLDLMSGYYQIPVSEESRKFTAFHTHEGHFEFARMPFGLVNAPSVFQACMTVVQQAMKSGETVIYLDDVVIPSHSIEEGIERLRRFLDALTTAGLTLRLDKCVFLAERITFMGHNISREGNQPGEIKAEAIREFAVPKDIHEVRRFLGRTGFFRKFVPNYAHISKPITELLKTTGSPQFVWGKDQQQAFDFLNTCLCSAPVLCLYDASRQHEVHTDASSVDLAGILMQLEGDGKWHPVFYYSRHCSIPESRYASHEL